MIEEKTNETKRNEKQTENQNWAMIEFDAKLYKLSIKTNE